MNYKDGDTITYRDTPFEYHEWVTFDGKQAKGFHCDDETLSVSYTHLTLPTRLSV